MKKVKYTLYIDESGDFESSRGQWVLAGLLFSDSYENCESIITNKLNSMPKRLGLRSIKDFHLTEFRRDFGHDKAVDMAKQLYRKIDTLPINYHAIASINYTKSSLSSREKNYRLMLADILAVCETVVPDDQIISKLDLVVASRTIDGELQTSISNINQDIINSLPIALEVDLATKGLIDLMGKNIKVHMDYANNSWGLVCADFLANLNYHNRKADEKELLNTLRQEGKYSLFESFGSFDVRRAHVAERNKDYVLALFRWIVIGYEKDESVEVKESIQRLLSKVFTTQGTTGYGIAFEALVERLWRTNNSADKYADLARKLRYFENQLIEYIKTISKNNYDNLLFRLRNLMLIVENHLASTVNAFEIIEKQNKSLPSMVINPENFQKVLDFKVIETEAYINSLELEKALSLAVSYTKLMESYKDVWQLLLEDDDMSGFDSSRAHIKSEMSLFRIAVMCIGLYDSLVDRDIDSNVSNLEPLLTNRLDLSRFDNYKIMLLLKQCRPEEAVSFFINDNMDKSLSIFDMLWFLRSVNDALLSFKDIDIPYVNSIVEARLNDFDFSLPGHPVDIVLRELALFHHQIGNKSKAMKYIAKSVKMFDLGKSEISLFLRDVIEIHNDYIKDQLKADDQYFNELSNNPFVQSILKSTIELSFFRKIRYFSMY